MNIAIRTGLLLTLGFLISCNGNQPAQQQAMGPAPFPVVEVPVRSVTAQRAFPARLQGIVSSEVRAKVAGYITEVLVDEGQSVKKGEPLFRLETQTLTQDAGAARANVEAARVEVNRLKPLVEKGIVGQVQLETAQARLAQAEAVYKSIGANIDYATIRSPVDGHVGAINFRQGALVSAADPLPLTTVAKTERIYAFFSMNERDYLDFIKSTPGKTLTEKIANFPPVQLRLVNDDIYTEPGRIETVTGQVNPSTGSVAFRAVFPNPDRLLADGSSGVILIPRTYENMPVVPEAATFEQQGITYVFRVRDDTAISTPLEVADRADNLVVVSSGVSPGDKIVASGVAKLRHNTPIQPQPVPFDSVAKELQAVFK
ncbi:MAG TPA: efflux RND transporter periplasmic adaptor subunit [Cyclobacteriaceae bacterium]